MSEATGAKEALVRVFDTEPPSLSLFLETNNPSLSHHFFLTFEQLNRVTSAKQIVNRYTKMPLNLLSKNYIYCY